MAPPRGHIPSSERQSGLAINAKAYLSATTRIARAKFLSDNFFLRALHR
jgi:hypothetical protein